METEFNSKVTVANSDFVTVICSRITRCYKILTAEINLGAHISTSVW